MSESVICTWCMRYLHRYIISQYLEFHDLWNANYVKRFVLFEHSEFTNLSNLHVINNRNSYTDKLVPKEIDHITSLIAEKEVTC